jgi:hypothetical protein
LGDDVRVGTAADIEALFISDGIKFKYFVEEQNPSKCIQLFNLIFITIF